MTDDEYRHGILALEDEYTTTIRKLLIRRSERNKTFARLPQLIYFTPEAANIAQLRDKQMDEHERAYYRERGFDV